jgi:Ca2+/Na+ antiporter
MFVAGIGVTVLLLTRERIGRVAGGLLFASYLAYVVSLFVFQR